MSCAACTVAVQSNVNRGDKQESHNSVAKILACDDGSHRKRVHVRIKLGCSTYRSCCGWERYQSKQEMLKSEDTHARQKQPTYCQIAMPDFDRTRTY